MESKHIGLGISVAALWALSFVAVKVGLKDVPPFALIALRLFFTAFPLVFFIKPPKIRWSLLIPYGVLMFTCHLGLLTLGVYFGVPVGIAAAMIQFQIFFTAFFAWFFLREKISKWHFIGAIFSLLGLGIFALNFGNLSLYKNQTTVFIGVFCILLAALSWGCANILTRKIGKVDPIALLVWGSLVAAWPLFACSIAFEDFSKVMQAILHMNYKSILAIVYMTYGGTFLAFTLWNKLLGVYPAMKVAPFALLVPPFALMFSATILAEDLAAWKLICTFFIVFGVAFIFFGNAVASKALDRQPS
ncbi:MAG: EamA family transporter [Acidovorax sp.]